MEARVLIADDSAFMRRLLRESLAEDHEVVGEAENGVEVVERYEEVRPDVVVLDVDMPIQSGVEAAAEIRANDPDAPIVMCSRLGQEETLLEAIEADAAGYVTKPFQKPGIVRAVRDAASAGH